MKKIYALSFLFLFLLSSVVIAHDDHDAHPPADIGEAIVGAEMSCEGLTKDQVYGVGVYLYGDHPIRFWTRLRARLGYCRGR